MDPEATVEWEDLRPEHLEALLGVRCLDRGLELGPDALAELVAVDQTGRLVLALRCGAGSDAPLHSCVDALAFVRENGAVIARHLDSDLLEPSLPVLIVLVVERCEELLLRRLAALAQDQVWVCELRSIRSAAGSSTELVRVDRGVADARTSGQQVEDFMDAQPVERHGMLERLMAGMDRVDERVGLSVTSGALCWHLEGRPLARLQSEGGGLWGSVASAEEECLLEQEEDVELFLEEVLAHIARGLGAFAELQDPPPGELSAEESGLESGEEPLPVRELFSPHAELGVLSPEELDALRG